MRIATWNVNSIKQRMDNLTAWLTERQPDIVCLQETKCVDDAFPREPLEALGYNVAVHGQKAFNGVAVLSKFPLDDVTARLPGDNADDHARFMELVVSTAAGVLLVVATVMVATETVIASNAYFIAGAAVLTAGGVAAAMSVLALSDEQFAAGGRAQAGS